MMEDTLSKTAQAKNFCLNFGVIFNRIPSMSSGII